MLRTNKCFNIAIDMMHYECNVSGFVCADYDEARNNLTNKNLS